MLFDKNVAVTIQSNTTGCILPIGYNSNFAILKQTNKQTNKKQTNKTNTTKQNKTKQNKKIQKKKQKLFSIRVKKLFEPIVLKQTKQNKTKKKRRLVALQKAFS